MPIPKRKALKSVSVGKGPRPDWMQRPSTSRGEAVGTHRDVNNTSVQSTGMIRSAGSTGITRGSTQPQAPDQASVTRSVINERISTPPKQHEAGMAPVASPPTDAGIQAPPNTGPTTPPPSPPPPPKPGGVHAGIPGNTGPMKPPPDAPPPPKGGGVHSQVPGNTGPTAPSTSTSTSSAKSQPLYQNAKRKLKRSQGFA